MKQHIYTIQIDSLISSKLNLMERNCFFIIILKKKMLQENQSETNEEIQQGNNQEIQVENQQENQEEKIEVKNEENEENNQETVQNKQEIEKGETIKEDIQSGDVGILHDKNSKVKKKLFSIIFIFPT